MRLAVNFCAIRLALLIAVAAGIGSPETRADDIVLFEVHAVADRPGPHTQPYLGVQAGADGKTESVLLMNPPLLDSKAIRFVSVDYDPEAHPIILINLTAGGTKRFEQITKEMVGKQLGFVIGGQLYSTPRIMETVRGGKIAISGSFTARQAANLAERLNAALPGKTAER